MDTTKTAHGANSIPTRGTGLLIGQVAVATLVVAIVLGLSMTVRHLALEVGHGAEMSRAWAERVNRFEALGDLASGISVPTRDLASPADAAVDLDRIQTAIGRLTKPLEQVRQELKAAPVSGPVDTLLQDVDSVGTAIKQLSEEIFVLYSYLRNGMVDEATKRLTAVTTARAALRQSITGLIAHARDAQEADLLAMTTRVDATTTWARYLPLVSLLLSAMLLAQGLGLWRALTTLARQTAEAGRGQTAFLTGMSHAIRAPMNAIFGMTALLLETKLQRDQQECLETIKASAQSLFATLSNVLDYAKLRAGRLEMEALPFDLRSAVFEAIRMVQHRANRKGLEILWHIDPEVPDRIEGDVKRLQQILFNLLDNAVKFTDHGEIVVRCRSEGEVERGVALSFDVTDTGIGIPPERQTKLLRGSPVVEDERTGQVCGTGLGVALTAALVEEMGGDVSLESEPGKGSTFRFQVRFAVPSDASKARGLEPTELRDVPILVVDDSATSRRILVGMLRGWGALPSAAESLEDATRALASARTSGRPFSVVLADLGLPGDGAYVLATRLRQDAELGRAACVALSPTGQEGEGERSRNAGFGWYLTQPVRSEDLLASLRAALEGVPTPEIVRPAASTPGRSLRVLLADDTKVDRMLSARLLTKNGHQVTEAGTGKEAAEIVARESFDVVLMDIEMPEMDGLQATRAIRERERTCGGRVPIIALTAHDNKGRCLEVGMDWYVSKPVKPIELLEALARVAGSATASPGAGSSSTTLEPPVDVDAALARADGDRGLLADLARVHTTESQNALRAIRDGLASGDRGIIEEAAANLQQALEVLCARPAAEVAGQIGAAAAEGHLDRAATALRQLEQALERLAPEVARLARSSDDPTRTS